ncbi:ArnT family glycosyltransferase [Mycolicibacterium confluentis]|uniref:Uncharacterized protein n=1 Tax=Mycolicibacterium confluentis TaxID=28047 RepID=A0A7I7XYJ7_9MYCO|nr:hypothetical protein [Mycolicibacterium confluentis]MCV7321494.1 hypothetical protein [Mycolicibacterium confluentis]ORV30060.1 hypothetical protein AWB99_13080 [Mycolicibacterium confluentis]BBZ34418.1 hypothetical protein MCNF_30230 [Mycolicibacterium confluentis]
MAWAGLPIGLVLLTVLVLHLGPVALPDGTGFERLLAGGLLTTALVVLGTWSLAAVGMLNATTLLTVLGLAAVAAVAAARLRGTPVGIPWRSAVSWASAPVLAVAAVAVLLAVVSAWLLPVWQWDALGYHLPFVNLVLQRGTLADVPVDVPYLSTYPHVVEWAFTAGRALLPDDRLVELGHLPFGLLGVVAIAAVAHRFGARPDVALAAGAAWLTLPAVFLQLPTNYTDVASAALALGAIAFLLADLDRARVLLAGLAIGLFLGSKPQAPLAAAVLLGVLAVAAWRAGLRREVGLAWLLALAIGTPTYVVNIARHGNPVWPVRVDVGPVHLPGTTPMTSLLNSGAAVPRAHGTVPARVLESWTTLLPPVPAFDMRLGGLGLLFLIALPVAVIRAVRTRSWAVATCFVATLATPDPSVARYVLAFAGLTLAFAAGGLPARGWGRGAVAAAIAVIAAGNLVIAYPGLTGEGPPLTAYPAMSPAERQRAVGASGPPIDYLDALEQMAPGEVTVIDTGAELPYLAWPADLSRAAFFAPVDLDAAGANRVLDRGDVGLLIVGDDGVLGRAARARPDLFEPAFRCRSAPCTGYLRR